MALAALQNLHFLKPDLADTHDAPKDIKLDRGLLLNR